MLFEFELFDLVGKHAFIGKKRRLWIVERLWKPLPHPQRQPDPLVDELNILLASSAKKRGLRHDRKRVRVNLKKIKGATIDDESTFITFGRSHLCIVFFKQSARHVSVTE
jgi:hypothetical protein